MLSSDVLRYMMTWAERGNRWRTWDGVPVRIRVAKLVELQQRGGRLYLKLNSVGLQMAKLAQLSHDACEAVQRQADRLMGASLPAHLDTLPPVDARSFKKRWEEVFNAEA